MFTFMFVEMISNIQLRLPALNCLCIIKLRYKWNMP